MRFGHFDDAAREYVIETPRTPYPWINYLGTEEFFGLVSHTGGGYCFYRDARLRRLTRYRYNNVPTDVGGRYYYVHDGGDYWTPGWAPVKRELDYYECRVGLSYTRITGERNGVRAEVLYFVPLATNAEVHRVTLLNTSKAASAARRSWTSWPLVVRIFRSWSSAYTAYGLVSLRDSTVGGSGPGSVRKTRTAN